MYIPATPAAAPLDTKSLISLHQGYNVDIHYTPNIAYSCYVHSKCLFVDLNGHILYQQIIVQCMHILTDQI